MAVALSAALDINSIQYQEQAIAPSTPAATFIQTWAANDKKLKSKDSDALIIAYNGLIATQTADATIANTVTETTLLGTVLGTLTLPADFLIAGRVIRLTMSGYISTTGTPNITIRSKLGSSEVIGTGAFAVGAVSNVGWSYTSLITCRAAGVSGSVVSSGIFSWNNGSIQHAVKTTSTTIDTTITQAIDITGEWSVADALNTITSQLATVEILY